jgi:hypothetical protein
LEYFDKHLSNGENGAKIIREYEDNKLVLNPYKLIKFTLLANPEKNYETKSAVLPMSLPNFNKFYERLLYHIIKVFDLKGEYIKLSTKVFVYSFIIFMCFFSV